MKLHGAISGTIVLASLVGPAGPARAQGAPDPPPATATATVTATAAQPAPAAARPTVKDGVRLRGGFSVNGGVFLLPANPVGGAASLAGRIGVQFNHYLALYYQNTPIVGATVAHEQRSGTVVAADYNSLLVNLTLFHMLDLGAGPSLDYVALAKGSISGSGLASSPSVSTGTGVAGGGHARVAFNIGGLSGEGPRRSGFSIGVDAHPMFLATGSALSLTVGLGGEWY